MMASIDKIKVSEFFSICAQLVAHTARVTKKIVDENSFNARTKGIAQEVFTDADVQVQATIFKGLKNFWPALNIIGEEDEVYEGPIDVEWSSINPSFFDAKDLFGDKIPEDIPIDKATVWIDPIDGTTNFVKGDFEAATTLIGLCVGSEPRLGVIGKYFYLDNTDSEIKKFEYRPACTFADATIPRVFRFQPGQESPKPTILTATMEKEKPKDLTLISSQSRKTDKLVELLESLNPSKILYEGGCGNKILAVLEDRAHVYVFPGNSTSKWDTAAPDAIMKSFGGFLTDFSGANFYYPTKKENTGNKNGLLATKSKAVHEELTTKLAGLNW